MYRLRARLGTLLLGFAALPASASVMDAFAGMPDGTLGYLLSTTNGSAIRRDFAVNAGDQVTFDWNYRSGDWVGFDDASWVSVNGAAPTVLARTSYTGVPLSGGMIAPDGFWTGWQSFSWTVTGAEAAAGSMFMTFGVNNVYDLILPSWLAIDNFRINGALLANSDFENGDLSNWSAVGNVNVLQGAHTFPGFTTDGDGDGITYGQTNYDFAPSQGDWFALLTSVGADASGSVTPGSLPEVPLLPPQPDPDNPWVWTFTGIPSGAWSDPPFANGFLYEAAAGTLFSSINFPIGPAFLPFSDLTLSLPGCAVSDLFGNGSGNLTTFDFVSGCGGPISQFSITSSSFVFDAGNNAGFPLQIFFDGGGPGSFSMTAINPQIPGTIPEPGTVLLFGAGLGLFVCYRRRRING
jgi:hypothetical protein